MSRIVHFEFNTTDVEKTTAFFEGTFGWKFQTWDGPDKYWLTITGDDSTPGINGGLMSMEQEWPATVNILGVDSVDAATEKVTTGGGEIIIPKMAIKGVGWAAYCKDPTGLIFGVYQEDRTAA